MNTRATPRSRPDAQSVLDELDPALWRSGAEKLWVVPPGGSLL